MRGSPSGLISPRRSAQWMLEGRGELRLRHRDLPPLAADHVRVRFAYCGVCGSDVSKFEGRRSTLYPESLGHEFVGEVIDVADGAGSLRPGNVVTSDLNFRCGTCDRCTAGRSHLCRTGQRGGFSNRAFAQVADLQAGYLPRCGGLPPSICRSQNPCHASCTRCAGRRPHQPIACSWSVPAVLASAWPSRSASRSLHARSRSPTPSRPGGVSLTRPPHRWARLSRFRTRSTTSFSISPGANQG